MGSQWKQPGVSRGFRIPELLLVYVAALTFTHWNVGWLLSERFYGIDDGMFMRWNFQAAAGWSEEGPGSFWKLIPSQLKNYGPVYSGYGLLCYFFLGHEWPGAYHLTRILIQALSLTLIWGAARRLNAGYLGAFAAVFFTYCATSPRIFPDNQTYTANWFRVYSSDAHSTLPLAGFWFFLSSALYERGRRLTAYLVLAGLAMAAVVLVKANYVYMAGVPAVCGAFAVGAPRLRRHGGKVLTVFLPLLTVIGVIAFGYYGGFSSQPGETNYAEKPALDLPVVIAGADFYWSQMEEVFFLLLLIPVGLFVAVVVRLLNRVGGVRSAWRNILIIGIMAAATGGFLAQITWPILLPRYALSFMPHVALAVGVGLGWLWRLRREMHGRRVFSFCALAFVAGLIGIGGLYALRLPAPVRLGSASGLILGPVLMAGVADAWLWSRRRTVTGGVVLPAVLGLMLAVFAAQSLAGWLAFREARAAFQSIYRGRNGVRDLLSSLHPRSGDYNLISSVTPEEFFWGGLWLLNNVEGRADITWGAHIAENRANRFSVLTSEFLPAPHDPERWNMRVRGQWRYDELGTTIGDFVGTTVLSRHNPVEMVLGATGRETRLGKIVVRVDSSTLHEGRDLRVTIHDQRSGQLLVESRFRGIESPAIPSNELAVYLDRPVPIPPDVPMVFRLELEEVPLPWLRRQFTADTPGAAVLLMQRGASNGGPAPGFALSEASPWHPEFPSGVELRHEEVEEAWRILMPSTLLRNLIKSPGVDYTPASARRIQFRTASYISVLASR